VDTEEFSGSDYRRSILQDFNQQLVRLKRNFLAGKDIYEGGKPYIRKQNALALPSVEETRSEVIVEQEPDTIKCKRLANPGG